MPCDPIMSVTTDGFAAMLVSLLASQQPAPKVVLLAQDPGTVVKHILQREGYQVYIGSLQQVVADALAANPDLIFIEQKILEQLIRGGGNVP